jgi:hypothetical protein
VGGFAVGRPPHPAPSLQHGKLASFGDASGAPLSPPVPCAEWSLPTESAPELHPTSSAKVEAKVGIKSLYRIEELSQKDGVV